VDDSSAVPTPGEKKALLFLSLVAVLGAGARLLSANAIPVPSEEEIRALDGQLLAVDSVRRGRRPDGREQRKGKAVRKRAVRAVPDTALPVPAAARAPLIDVDRASVTELEVLPGIGPALARRIVAARDSSGPFGSLDALQTRVRGVGPALSKRLAQAVTFSGPHSPPSAERTEPFGNGTTPARSKRRRRH
jgi:DNA uptake protein ComE-like DNA-binding protein